MPWNPFHSTSFQLQRRIESVTCVILVKLQLKLRLYSIICFPMLSRLICVWNCLQSFWIWFMWDVNAGCSSVCQPTCLWMSTSSTRHRFCYFGRFSLNIQIRTMWSDPSWSPDWHWVGGRLFLPQQKPSAGRPVFLGSTSCLLLFVLPAHRATQQVSIWKLLPLNQITQWEQRELCVFSCSIFNKTDPQSFWGTASLFQSSWKLSKSKFFFCSHKLHLFLSVRTVLEWFHHIRYHTIDQDTKLCEIMFSNWTSPTSNYKDTQNTNTDT